MRMRRPLLSLALAVCLPLSGALVAPAVAQPSGAVATAVVAESLKPSRVTGRVTESWIRKGETFWFSGSLTVGGSPASGRSVKIHHRAPGSSRWSLLTTVTTNQDGWFQARVRPGAVREYRAYFPKTSTSSGSWTSPLKVAFTSRARSNASRADALGSRIGKATTALRSAGSGVYHRSFTKGMLVTVKGQTTRTWWVHGGILAAYKNRGGPGGSLGHPIQDARCGLVWGGCVQRFSKGVVYANAKGAKGVTTTTGRRGEVVAAARSQVGYRVKAQYGTSRYLYYSKYNAWNQSNTAWCGIFQSWAFAASGNGNLVPQSKTFGAYLDGVRRTLPRGSTPRVGALGFVSYVASGEPSHVMYIVGWNSTHVRVVHGNTTGLGALPAGTRGVLEQSIPRSQILFYAYPRY